MRGDLSAGRAGENPEISVTLEQLANQINSSLEVVSGTLKNMEKQNIVRLRRGRITILNQKELTRLRLNFLLQSEPLMIRTPTGSFLFVRNYAGFRVSLMTFLFGHENQNRLKSKPKEEKSLNPNP